MFGHGNHHYDNSQVHQQQQQQQGQWPVSSEDQLQHLGYQQQQQHRQQEYQHHQQHQHYPNQQPYQYTLAHAPLYEYGSGSGTPAELSSRPPSSSSAAQTTGFSQTGYGQQQHQHQHQHIDQRFHQANAIETNEPPKSSGSVGSESVSSGESAATTGPSTVAQPAQQSSHPHYSHQSLPQTPSSFPQSTSSSSNAGQNDSASMQASPLFDVPPGYRTMLSSDKPAVAISQQQQQHVQNTLETGGSAPVRHHSMPSSVFASTVSLGGAGNEKQPPPSIQPVQPPHHQSQATPSASSSSSTSSPFSHTATPYYTASPAPLAHNSLAQTAPQYQQQQNLSQHQHHLHSSSSSTSGSGSSSFATTSISSKSNPESSDLALGRSSRYPRRHMHQSEDMTHNSAPQHPQQQQDSNDSQFIAPAPPTSAPATTTTFAISGKSAQSGAGRQVQGRSGMFKLEPSDESYMRFAHRNSTSSSSVGGMSVNASSTTHSRSPSVSSTTYSSFGPLSASTSSSASSSFGDLSSSTSTPRRAMRLSNLDRRALCQYAEANPRVKHEHIGSMFGVERSTVSKILKQKAKWFSVSDDNTIPLSPTSERKTREGKLYKNRIGRHPEMETMVIEWGKEQTRKNIILSDESVRNKALEFAEQLKIDSGSFKASAGWLENFKERAKYKSGKFDLDAIPPALLSSSSTSSRDPSEEIMDSDADSGEKTITFPEDKVVQGGDQANQAQGATTSDSLSGHMQSPQLAMGRVASSIRHRRQRRGLSSLSSSSISLPDLVEHGEHGSTDMEHSSSSVDLRSRGSSFSNLNMQPLNTTITQQQQQFSTPHSTDSSPYPSPTCSTSSELGQNIPSSAQTGSLAPTAQTSTPTQRRLYNVGFTPQSGDHQYRPMYTAGPPSTRLQQAGINFNLSLNSSPSLQSQHSYHLPTIEAGQPLDLTHHNAPIDQVPIGYDAFSYPHENVTASPHQQGAFDIQQGGPIYAMRARIQSAPGDPQHSHLIPFAVATHDAGQHVNPVSYGYTTISSPSHQEQFLMNQHTVPLHRSQTDPMPLYSAMTDRRDDTVLYVADSTLTPADAGEMGTMQVDQAQHQHQSQESMASFQQHHYVPQPGHTYVQAPHARRATVSSGGDLSFSSGSGTGSSYGHGHSYSMSAVTTPIYGTFAAAEAAAPPTSNANTKVSLHEAYLSLRKVVNFLQEDDSSESMRSNLATSSQTEALEALLVQLRQAHISQIPTLTPPRST